MGKLFDELKRRKVFRMAALYAVVAWVLIQVADTIAPLMNLPESAPRLILFLLIMLFPVAVLLAWTYEVTPEGIKTDSTIQSQQNPIPGSSRKFDYAILALLLLLAGFQIAERYPIASNSSSSNSVQERGFQSVSRFTYSIPYDQRLRSVGRNTVALSPDGRHFVYNTINGIYLRRMDEINARLVAGTEEALTNPFFSPDSLSIAYWAVGSQGSQDGQLKRIDISGGAPEVISNLSENPSGASWGQGDTILFALREGIFRVSASGGVPELVVAAQERETFDGPTLLPDGDTILFSARSGADWDQAQIIAYSLAANERKVLIEGGSDPHYQPTGHLTYALGDTIFVVEFDLDNLTILGSTVPVIQRAKRAVYTASANFAVSDNGTAIYLQGNSTGTNVPYSFVWVDQKNVEETLGIENCFCAEPALSPDGKRLAITLYEAGRSESDIWIWSFEQRTLTRLTVEPGAQRMPTWSPDGERIAYGTARGIFARRANGTGSAELLLTGENLDPYSWSEEGDIVFVEFSQDLNGYNIGKFSIGVDPEHISLLSTEFDEIRPALSPNGRWLAYASNETGEFEIYVRPYPDVDSDKWQLSSGGGEEPRWSSDGSKLFYFTQTGMLEAAIEPGAEFRNTLPLAVLDNSAYITADRFPRHYEVSQNGERFIMLKVFSSTENREGHQIIVVQNWFEELKRLAPTDQN